LSEIEVCLFSSFCPPTLDGDYGRFWGEGGGMALGVVVTAGEESFSSFWMVWEDVGAWGVWEEDWEFELDDDDGG
jgi:hypothetical protein